MPTTVSPSRRPGAGRWWGRALTRGDLLTFLIAAMLWSASYYLAIWHNSRGAADSLVLEPSASAAGASSDCQSDARVGAGAADADEPPLDFEAHHTAESAELSVSASAPAATTTATTTRARRALRGAVAAWAGNSGRGAEAVAGAGASRYGESALRVRPPGLRSVRAVSASEPW